MGKLSVASKGSNRAELGYDLNPSKLLLLRDFDADCIGLVEQIWTNDNLKLYYSLTLMILQYFFPLAVLVFTYTRIALAVWGKKAPGEAEDGRDQRLAKAKRKVTTPTFFKDLSFPFPISPI